MCLEDVEGETRLGSFVGDVDLGVELLVLVLLDPRVAIIEGDDGGSGERVKYTTFARDPPTYPR